MYMHFNPNPQNKIGEDCVIRAVAKVMEIPWERAYTELCLEGLRLGNVPSSNAVWGTYLHEHGFVREPLPNTCPDCYTVNTFCLETPKGTYILATGSHVVAVIDGNYYDAWDSGEEVPVFAWKKEGE